MDDVPKLNTSGLGKQDAEAARIVDLALTEMDNQIDNFRAALALFDHAAALRAAPTLDASSVRMPSAWRMIAARDAVMCVYHFWQAMEAAKEMARKHSPVKAMVDWDKVRASTDRLKRDFPGRESMRQSAAHWAELHRNPKESRKNSMTGTYNEGGIHAVGVSSAYISSTLFNREYRTMYRGQTHKLDISHGSVTRLEAIRDEFYSAFRAFSLP